MKRFFYGLILLSALILMSFQASQTGNAIVEKRNGIDIYMMSEPITEYDVLDSGKVTVLLDCNEIVNKSIRKAKKAKADGVIIYYETGRYDAIKYK